MTIRCVLLLCAALAALPPAARAATTGTLTGTVKSAQGKPLEHVQVRIIETGEITLTDSKGGYTFTREEPGACTIQASVLKYKPETLTVTIASGATEHLDLVLELVPKYQKPLPLAKGAKPPTAIISVIMSQGHRVVPPPPEPLEAFPGEVGLHATARSR